MPPSGLSFVPLIESHKIIGASQIVSYPLAQTISFLARQTIGIQNLSRIVSSVAVSTL